MRVPRSSAEDRDGRGAGKDAKGEAGPPDQTWRTSSSSVGTISTPREAIIVGNLYLYRSKLEKHEQVKNQFQVRWKFED